jgi:hypothetical protein
MLIVIVLIVTMSNILSVIMVSLINVSIVILSADNKVL